MQYEMEIEKLFPNKCDETAFIHLFIFIFFRIVSVLREI